MSKTSESNYPEHGGSSVLRWKLCPGSRVLEEQCPELIKSHSVDDEGTLLHNMEADENLDRSELTEDQMMLLEDNRRLIDGIIEAIKATEGLSEGSKCLDIREKTFWVYSDYKSKSGRLFPCHPDRILYWPAEQVLVVLDYKFGYIPVTPANANYQLRAYILALAAEYPFKKAYGAITQPRLHDEKLSSHYTVYGKRDLSWVSEEIIGIFNDTHEPNAPRVPSPQACQYCRGLGGSCPESLKMTIEAPRDLMQLVAERRNDPARVAQAFEAMAPNIQVAKMFVDASWKMFREALKMYPDHFTEWKLQSTGDMPRIVDTIEAFNRLQGLGVGDKEYMEACKLSIGKVEDLVYRKTKAVTKAYTKDRAKNDVRTALGEVLQLEPKEKRVVRSLKNVENG